MLNIIWIIVVILIICWLLGLTVFHVGGLINILIVIAVICIIYWFVTSRRGRGNGPLV